jgi:hypothetical protein
MSDPFGPEAHALGMVEAELLKVGLERGERLPTYDLAGIVLQSDESAFREIVAEYSRYLERSVQFPVRPSLFVMGSPAFITGAIIAKAFGDAADRRAARRLAVEAAPQWRFLGFPRVILTNQRFLVYAEDQYKWLSFWHSGLQEHRQRPDFGLELLYPDCAPVLLRGPMIPWVSIALASCVRSGT